MALDSEGNKNGFIDKEEFQGLTKRLGMNLSEHRINEIFAHVKN